MRLRRLWAAVCLTVAAVATGGAGAYGFTGDAPSLPSLPAAVVVPPDYGNAAQGMQIVLGDAEGVVTHGYEALPAYVFTPTAGVSEPLPPGWTPVSLVGQQLVESRDDGTDTEYSAVDLTAVGAGPVELTTLSDSKDCSHESFITGTGTGWLSLVPNGGELDVVRHENGATSVVNEATTPLGCSLAAAVGAADSDGAGLSIETNNGAPGSQSGYLDFASGVWTDLPNSYEWVLTPKRLAWLERSGAEVDLEDAPRGPSPVGTVRAEFPSDEYVSLAANGDATAWSVGGAAYSTASDDAPAVQVAGRMSGDVVVAAGAGFAAQYGLGAADEAAYDFASGSATRGLPVWFAGPYGPDSIDAGPGTVGLQASDENGDSALVTPQTVWQTTSALGVAADGPPVTEADGTANSAGIFQLSNHNRATDSGNLRAYLVYAEDGSGSCTAVLQRSGVTVLRLPAPSPCAAVSLSGNELMVAGVTSSTLYDLDTGAQAPCAGDCRIWGRRVVSASPDGTIAVRDLGLPVAPETVLRSPSDGKTFEWFYPDDLQLHGDWVSWTLEDSEFAVPSTTVAHLTPAGAVDRAFTLPVDAHVVQLGDGLLAYQPETPLPAEFDPNQDLVHVVDLTLSTPGHLVGVVVGTGHMNGGTPGRQDVALTDETVDYVGGDGALVLQPLPFPADAGPRLLGYLPAASGLPFRASVASSRPLTEWTFTVTDRTGAVVHRQTGVAPTGSIPLSWDGTLDSGGVAPVGRYTWQLSGIGPGGTLADAVGDALPITGTFTVPGPASSAPFASASPRKAGAGTLTVPGPAPSAPFASASPGKAGVVVSWSAVNAVEYDVAVMAGTQSSDGRIQWSAAKPWLTRTSATSATYAGRPVPEIAGAPLRFVVTPRNALNDAGATVTAQVTLPLDDMSRALRFAGGWHTVRTRGSWQGTVHRSSAAGAQLSFRTSAHIVQIIGTRCASCGSARVVIDNRLVTTLSSRGRQGQQAVLATVRLGPTGWHTIVLDTLSAKPVAIDNLDVTF